jgi:phosphoribosylanthranilate isomerase
MTLVKICGITNLPDALTAVDAGADYLGFIFYPASQRAITVAAAQSIVSQLRARPDCPLLVGVFVNETAVAMTTILEQCRLDLAQLSGEEPPFLVGDPASPLYGRAYKALRPTSLAEAEADAEWYMAAGWGAGIGDQGSDPRSPIPDPRSPLPDPHSPIPDPRSPIPDPQSPSPAPEPQSPSLLIDTYHPALRGGTGETGDWSMIARLAESVPGIMLAGGLTAANVAQAVRQVRPFAVDVASGVEASPGRKNPGLVQQFIQSAKGSLTIDH